MDKGLNRLFGWHILVVFGTLWQIMASLTALEWLLSVDFGWAISAGIRADESAERSSQISV
jgi:hypothetical protein